MLSIWRHHFSFLLQLVKSQYLKQKYDKYLTNILKAIQIHFTGDNESHVFVKSKKFKITIRL